MKVLPVVVSMALLASLFESLVILPSHVAELGGKRNYDSKKKEHKLHAWLVRNYRKTVKKALKHRIRTVLILVTAMILSLIVMFSGLVRFQFFARRSPRIIVLNLETPPGTSLEKTDEIVTKVEEYILSMPDKEDIEAVISTVGKYSENHNDKIDTKNAEIKLDLVDLDDMKFSNNKIKNRIRKYIEILPELYSFTFKD